MKNNPICEVLGIEYPVFQGGMAWVSDADLAGAVSEAGAEPFRRRSHRGRNRRER